jgi:hypothetical protein
MRYILPAADVVILVDFDIEIKRGGMNRDREVFLPFASLYEALICIQRTSSSSTIRTSKVSYPD